MRPICGPILHQGSRRCRPVVRAAGEVALLFVERFGYGDALDGERVKTNRLANSSLDESWPITHNVGTVCPRSSQVTHWRHAGSTLRSRVYIEPMHRRLLLLFVTITLLTGSAFGSTNNRRKRHRVVRNTVNVVKASFTTAPKLVGVHRSKKRVAQPFVDPTLGDSVDGEDLMARRAAVQAWVRRMARSSSPILTPAAFFRW